MLLLPLAASFLSRKKKTDQITELAKLRDEGLPTNEIIDKIIENTEVDIPAVMVENELDEIMKDMEYRLMYQGLNLQTYAEYMKTTVEAIRESSRERALKSVKVRLILTHILEKEKIDVTDAEVPT